MSAQSREGLDPATMRAIAHDAGVRITDLDPVGDWLPVEGNSDTPALFKSVWSRQQFLDCASELGIERLTAVQLAPDAVVHDVAVEGFTTLCDDAAAHGFGVQLEFMPFSGISNLSIALRLLRDADRANASLLLDVCHFSRSGGTADDLRMIPSGLVSALQLADGPLAAPTDTRDEAMFHRRLPGDGQFHVAELLAVLADTQVSCAVGPELYGRSWSERNATDVACDLMAATRRVL
ncbi:MAG: TIM barrel protein [Actinobacteria bacterium]|uniref:Unannotated protein n=1 Tax=freshwater metagenome TaxID=449393 RepID=A0A6J7C6V3_9ZZZZ|nr:TIM barrel protein [Actinomycetota bacterium]MSX56459.1 TIM barrel protein [Actinomycetota bacterium]MSZ82327.1 TIM barrel protein [Actinomycetota bacterium]MTB16494.1 TIM barrel protein [Actinomycetota bacterium]